MGVFVAELLELTGNVLPALRHAYEQFEMNLPTEQLFEVLAGACADLFDLGALLADQDRALAELLDVDRGLNEG